MGSILEQIFSSIENKYVISIIYENDRGDFYQQLHPYYIFENKEKIYLLALNASHNSITTYALNKIKSIEITSLRFSENVRPLTNYLGETKFNSRYVKKLDNEMAITKAKPSLDGSKMTYNKIDRLMDYYIRAVKLESLMEVNIASKDKEQYFFIDAKNTFNLIRDNTGKAFLSPSFKGIYVHWKNKIKYQPELVMYLGYPTFKIGDNYTPFIYYQVMYDEVENSLQLKSKDFYINGKFIEEDLELTTSELEDIKEGLFKNKTDITKLQGFNLFFEEVRKYGEIKDYGILFLQTDTSSTKGLLKELKNIKTRDKDLINVPFNSIIGGQDFSSNFESKPHIYNVIEMNESQEKVIRNSNRNLLLVQGPPGTGKTQTIVNLISNAVLSGDKVLIASMNNRAVDNIIEKMKDKGIYEGIIRLGNLEFRKSAVEEIKNKLEASYLFRSNNNLDSYRHKSVDLFKNIKINKQRLMEIEKLEEKLIELNTSFELQQKELENRSIDIKSIDHYLDNTNITPSVYLSLIRTLNLLSLYCFKLEERKNIWFWRLLSKIRFNSETYFVKGVKKRLINLGVNRSQFQYMSYLIEINTFINRSILLFQYYAIKLEIENIEMKLKCMDKSKVIANLNGLEKEKIDNDRELIKYHYNNTIAKINEEEKTRLLLKLETEGEGIFRQISAEYHSLLKMYPVIASTSLSAAGSIPQEMIFDLVIIDEGSQCNIPSSLPLIMRAKKLIIVGDDKQLNPVVQMDPKEDQKHMEEAGLGSENIYYSFSRYSTFDLFKCFIGKEHAYLLDEHYRCHPDIINFSNKQFYNNKLRIMTKEEKGDFYGIKSSLIDSEVTYTIQGSKSAVNHAEADAIIEFLRSNFNELKDKSIGIITPFRKQKELYVSKKEKLIKSCKSKEEEKFYSNLEIGTVHTFQGDERKIIIFSPVISNGTRDRTIEWVNEGRNLINVAVTRAINCFIMIGNINFIKQKKGILKELALYIENLGGRLEDLHIKSIFEAYKIIEKEENTELIYNPNIKSLMNPGEQKLHNLLTEVLNESYTNYEVGVKIRLSDVIQVDGTKVTNEEFRYSLYAHFDYVIFNKNRSSLPVLVIEFDGKYHRTDQRTIRNDTMKDNICSVFGMPLNRISSTQRIGKQEMKILLGKYL